MLARSYLFVPGDRQSVLDKAHLRGADALIVDLEDAVATSQKDVARRLTSNWLNSEPTGTQRWIRINAGAEGLADLALLDTAAVQGVMIPKVRHADEIDEVAERVSARQPNPKLLVLIETPQAFRDIDAIASHEAVYQLMIGEADLGAELSMSANLPTWDSLRADIVVASAAAAIEPPIGPVNPDFSSPDRLEAETRHLRDIGFRSRAVIHPAQIPLVHRGFQPTREELDRAVDLLRRHQVAQSAGRGAHLGEEGLMVDEAFVRRAREIVEYYRRFDPPVPQ